MLPVEETGSLKTMQDGLVKSADQPAGELILVLPDHPLVIAFLAARVNRPGVDANLEQAVFAAVTAGSGAGALLCEGKLHPEASKQFDCAETDSIQHHQRNYGEYTGQILGDEFDDGDKQEAAHQAAEQPGEAQIELFFVPAVELLMLHEPVVHASVLDRRLYSCCRSNSEYI
jgi:hypothetical protein